MSTELTPEETVEAIRALCPRTKGDEPVDTSYFHLQRCVCGVPMWQQPCPLCSYYPQGQRGAEMDAYLAQCKASVPDPRDAFIKAVTRAGNIAVWYVRRWRQTAAWGQGPLTSGLGPHVEVLAPHEAKAAPGPAWVTDKQVAFRKAVGELEEKARGIPCASPEVIFDLVCGDGVGLPRR